MTSDAMTQTLRKWYSHTDHPIGQIVSTCIGCVQMQLDSAKILIAEEQRQREKLQAELATARESVDRELDNIEDLHRAMLRRAERILELERELATARAEGMTWPKFAIRLASPNHVTKDRTTVDIEINGKWVMLIEEAGDIFCHIIEPAGVDSAIESARDAEKKTSDAGG